MAAPFPLGLSLLEVDDERNAVLQEVDAAALCQLKAASAAWCTHARRELCTRLCRYEGASITELDVECLNNAGRLWEVVIAGRQLPQLARLRSYGFVVDVRAVREADLGRDGRRDAPLGGAALRSCIQGEGDPPRELLLAAVACVASGWVRRVPVQRLREDDAIGSLNLGHACLGAIGAALLGLMLPAATSVRSLRLANSQLCGLDSWGSGTYTTEGFTKLCEWLKGSAVTSLDLGDNGLCGIDRQGQGTYTTEGIIKLCEGLQGSSVTSLDLAYNQLFGVDCDGNGTYTTEGITKLCEGLKGSAVTSLNLPNNDLGPKGGAALVEGLKGNSTLQSLNLAYNQLCGLDYNGRGTYTAEGINKLCEALKGSAVTSLDLHGNHLGPDGGAALAEGLKGNSTLQSLSLSGNGLRSDDLATKQVLLDASRSGLTIHI